MKNKIVVTGGSGFVGSNLIGLLLKKTKFKIISIDDYSSGFRSNHISNNRVKYIDANTKEISIVLNKYRFKINALFHFGEFARIYQSFLEPKKCMDSNIVGTNEVFSFCLKNKIKLIYSATSASLGNKGNDQNLSPYSFTKSKNLEYLENLKRWFNFKYEVVFFYNVYGPGHIKTGNMATVIGIFEDYFIKNKPLPVVKPGTQTRRFTHIEDTINICYLAWKNNKNKFYSVLNKKSYSILQIAKMFKTRIKFLKPRKGERYSSALTNMKLSNKIYRNYGKIKIEDYIREFVKNNKK